MVFFTEKVKAQAMIDAQHDLDENGFIHKPSKYGWQLITPDHWEGFAYRITWFTDDDEPTGHACYDDFSTLFCEHGIVGIYADSAEAMDVDQYFDYLESTT